MNDRNTIIPVAYLILKKKDTILFGRRAGTNYYEGWLSLPAGHVEYGESPSEAIIRETKEEIGIDLTLDQMTIAHVLYRPGVSDGEADRLDTFFVAEKTLDQNPEILEPDKCSELVWASLNDLPKDLCHVDAAVLQRMKAGEIYSEMSRAEVTEYNRLFAVG